MDCLLHISRIVVKPSAQNLHIGQWRPWLCHNGRRIQGSLCNYFFVQMPCIMSRQLCVHTIYLALRVMGSDKEQKRAQDDCNFGYFSTRLALLWHEALAIPLIQVIFCPPAPAPLTDLTSSWGTMSRGRKSSGQGREVPFFARIF